MHPLTGRYIVSLSLVAFASSSAKKPMSCSSRFWASISSCSMNTPASIFECQARPLKLAEPM